MNCFACSPRRHLFSVCSSLSSAVCRLPSVVRRPSSAFTLIEIMVVIGIIAVLAALLFPVVIGTGERAKQKKALADAHSIVAAIKAYRQEYGKWPAQTQATQDMTYVTNNHLVIQPLLGSNAADISGKYTNPKEIPFLSLQGNVNNPDYCGNYLDPWGIPYVICIDENEDNSLSLVWSNTPIMSYVASNASGRQIGATNIYLTNRPIDKVDVGVASLGGTSNILTYNSWDEIQ